VCGTLSETFTAQGWPVVVDATAAQAALQYLTEACGAVGLQVVCCSCHLLRLCYLALQGCPRHALHLGSDG